MFNPNEHMIPLKGKDYLQVCWRLVWLNEEHPDWSIETEIQTFDPDNKFCLYKAIIKDDAGRVKSTAHGSETAKDFPDYIEKAETKAIGRALAIAGYGTQFAPDIEELDNADNERLADAPVDRSKKKAAAPKATAQAKLVCTKCGNEITKWGKLSPEAVAKKTTDKFGYALCIKCGETESKKLKGENKNA